MSRVTGASGKDLACLSTETADFVPMQISSTTVTSSVLRRRVGSPGGCWWLPGQRQTQGRMV